MSVSLYKCIRSRILSPSYLTLIRHSKTSISTLFFQSNTISIRSSFLPPQILIFPPIHTTADQHTLHKEHNIQSQTRTNLNPLRLPIRCIWSPGRASVSTRSSSSRRHGRPALSFWPGVRNPVQRQVVQGQVRVLQVHPQGAAPHQGVPPLRNWCRRKCLPILCLLSEVFRVGLFFNIVECFLIRGYVGIEYLSFCFWSLFTVWILLMKI